MQEGVINHDWVTSEGSNPLLDSVLTSEGGDLLYNTSPSDDQSQSHSHSYADMALCVDLDDRSRRKSVNLPSKSTLKDRVLRRALTTSEISDDDDDSFSQCSSSVEVDGGKGVESVGRETTLASVGATEQLSRHLLSPSH